jgi:hypothetical protein
MMGKLLTFLMLAGVAAVTAKMIAPDVKRYIEIRNM